MTKQQMLSILNEILMHERKHFNFYLQATMCVRGQERLVLKPLFEKEMTSELEHIRTFGDKIVALGGKPTHECLAYYEGECGRTLIEEAIKMEREVLAVYHKYYETAEKWTEEHGDMSIALLLEENIEHTTHDVEELEKLL